MRYQYLFIIAVIFLCWGCKKPPEAKVTVVTSADLVHIILSNGALSPSFVQGTTSYRVSVDSSIRSVVLTPTTNIADAVVTVNGNAVISGYPSPDLILNEGDNIITTIVKAKDGSTAKTYTITVTRAPSANSPPYTTSYKAWLTYKDSVKNSYKYTFDYTSWIGVGWTTTITVKNGAIITRDYTQWSDTSGTHVKVTDKTWHEETNTLNTHGQEPVYFMTLDQIYVEAETVWLKVDPAKNTIYFETKNNGLMSLCGYFPNGCADDCFIGIHITSITPL